VTEPLKIEVIGEPSYRSHEVLDEVSHLLDVFDGVGSHFREDNGALAANMGQLAILANRFVEHIAEQEAKWDE
jgi:hypothetical protein